MVSNVKKTTILNRKKIREKLKEKKSFKKLRENNEKQNMNESI
jgi:hypothetical protein